MKDGSKPKYMPTRGMLNVRILAGVYLLYLVWQMNKGLTASTGADFAISVAAMVAFVVIGILLIVLSARSLKIGRYAGGVMDEQVGAEASGELAGEITAETTRETTEETIQQEH